MLVFVGPVCEGEFLWLKRSSQRTGTMVVIISDVSVGYADRLVLCIGRKSDLLLTLQSIRKTLHFTHFRIHALTHIVHIY
jgi:hypothetical protein